MNKIDYKTKDTILSPKQIKLKSKFIVGSVICGVLLVIFGLGAYNNDLHALTIKRVIVDSEGTKIIDTPSVNIIEVAAAPDEVIIDVPELKATRQVIDHYNEIRYVTSYCTRCRDGSLSPTCATGSGACSHHGGVAQFNEPQYSTRREAVYRTEEYVAVPAKTHVVHHPEVSYWTEEISHVEGYIEHTEYCNKIGECVRVD